MDHHSDLHSLWLDALRSEGDAVATACATAGLETPVESCPGWQVGDLLWHLTWVHDLFATWATRLSSVPERIERPERPLPDALLTTYRHGLDRLEGVLRSADPSAEVWTFTDDHTVRFLIRRMAHETAVHRWDAERAAGRVHAIPGELASDGIDEFLTHFCTPADDHPVPVSGSVHLHCGDVPGEWTLRPRADSPGFDLERAHAKGDCALRGPASDLLLALWHRLPLTALDVVGDPRVAAEFLDYPRRR